MVTKQELQRSVGSAFIIKSVEVNKVYFAFKDPKLKRKGSQLLLYPTDVKCEKLADAVRGYARQRAGRVV